MIWQPWFGHLVTPLFCSFARMSLDEEYDRLLARELELKAENQELKARQGQLDAARNALPDKNSVPEWLLQEIKSLTARFEALKADKEALTQEKTALLKSKMELQCLYLFHT